MSCFGHDEEEEAPGKVPYQARIQCPICDGGSSPTCAWLTCDLCLGKGFISPQRIASIWKDLQDYRQADR